MARRPASICGCGLRIASGERCPCAKRRKAAADAARPSAAARGYDAEWRKLRSRFLAAHPRCEACGAAAHEVDHVQSVAERPDLRLAWPNLRALCKSCHSRRTARDQAFGRGSPIAGRGT
ncbi:HNH endonuclease [Oharaeibacter diazotrophicus]|nr:HNH endonuclease signature motif containing protein [Oharaeibacter diazotrophicus]GLS75731.1 HNH endonuclease [Oharaeibacter diazotrophicus]